MLYKLSLGLFLLFLFIVTSCASVTTKDPKQNFVSLQDIDPSIILEIRYYGDHNFFGRRVKGYLAPKCYLTKKAAEALHQVQSELKVYSLSLKVYDCYRPQQAVDDFVAWAKDLSDTKMKKEFYPKVDKTNLFKEGYIADKSGHSRGSTMDLTLVSLPVAKQAQYKPGQKLVECYQPTNKRFRDNSLDMGTGYDCFDPHAHTASSDTGKEQQRNRLLLKSMMEKCGFKNLDEEWWHYTLKDEPFPNTYFNFPIE